MTLIPKKLKSGSGKLSAGGRRRYFALSATPSRNKFRLPFIGALSLSATFSSSANRGNTGASAAAANYTRQSTVVAQSHARQLHEDEGASEGEEGVEVAIEGDDRQGGEERGQRERGTRRPSVPPGAARSEIQSWSVSGESPEPEKQEQRERRYRRSSSNGSRGEINRRSVPGAARAEGGPRKAAFVSPPSPSRKGAEGQMKRGLSPVAFAASPKRSFGLSASASSEAAGGEAAVKVPAAPPLRNFRDSLSPSWISHLSAEDPENLKRSLARQQGHPGRPVFNGHYVLVRPAPLKNPKLVLHSPEVLRELGFREDEARSEAFVKYFSGDVEGAFKHIAGDDAATKAEKEIETWATPYALSIMGRRYTNNCPYGTGDGYGDGRAISVGEVLVRRDSPAVGGGAGDDGGDGVDVDDFDDGGYPRWADRYEMQLKGAGQTPFCRGADGRAVLRSSIREFLASEAMHHLGVSTTRALSLIVSEGGDTSTRPWYSDGSKSRELPKMNDPRLARYDDTQKREILSQLAVQAKSDPDMLVEEKCAITTRVASSFVRIGHLDLFARRVEAATGEEAKGGVRETRQYRELEDLMWHACYREFYDTAYAPFWEKKDAKGAALALMEGAVAGIAAMVGAWVRVGFVQGNFNADNCLVGGRTMDYGPFGFLDVYHPLSAKWTGSGEHFGFMNQPNAGYANFSVLVESLLPIIDANGGDGGEVRDDMLKMARSVFSETVDKVVRTKMGLDGGGDESAKDADELWGEIEPLLRLARGDWTVFWRQLTHVAAEHSPTKTSREERSDSCSSEDYDAMLAMLLGDGGTNPFYDKLSKEHKAGLRAWIEKWHVALTEAYRRTLETSEDGTPPEEAMRRANPKYTLREWMLVDAYTRADPGKSPGSPFPVPPGDYAGVEELFELCRDPYGEGSAAQHEKYYRRAPDESLRAGGTAFMS